MRGVRPIERAVEGHHDAEAAAIRGYCLAIRSALTDDGRACALEYNLLRWGRTELSPEAGLAVYARGSSGKLASARIYDDVDPPLNG